MTILSDLTIRSRFSELIVDGDPSRAGACEYYFVPGKINPTGIDEKGNGLPVIDWTSKALNAWPGETAHSILPGSLITLRTREQVKMPADYCGLWYQTDALSRKGLLLVNMSIIPPGYEGPLTCTFVNFGKNAISINPDTLIAKVLFAPLDKPAGRQTKKRNEREYDQRLSGLARELPSMFLQISDHTRKLDSIIEDGKAELATTASNLKASLGDNAVNSIKKAIPWAALAIILLTASQWFANNLLSGNVEKIARERADQIEEKINLQLEKLGGKPIIVYSGSPEAKALVDRLNALEKEIMELRAVKK